MMLLHSAKDETSKLRGRMVAMNVFRRVVPVVLILGALCLFVTGGSTAQANSHISRVALDPIVDAIKSTCGGKLAGYQDKVLGIVCVNETIISKPVQNLMGFCDLSATEVAWVDTTTPLKSTTLSSIECAVINVNNGDAGTLTVIGT